MEVDRLEDMEAEVNAEPTVFISKDHQRAMALDTDEVSVETRLTKGNAAPPPAIHIAENDEDHSALSGSTRESKAKRYADAAVKEVAAEYSGTIINMSNDLGERDDRIAELERLLNAMQQNNQQNEQESTTAMDIDNEAVKPTDEDDLLSYDSENPRDNNLEFQLEDNLELKTPTASASKFGDLQEDLDEEGGSLWNNETRQECIDGNVLSQSYLVPPTPLQTAPNIPQQSDRSLKRRTTDKEDIPVDTTRSTRPKTSLQIAAQEKTSSSEGANAL